MRCREEQRRVSECRGRRVLIRDRQAGSILAIFTSQTACMYVHGTAAPCGIRDREDGDSEEGRVFGGVHAAATRVAAAARVGGYAESESSGCS